jgi:hypothetical protein
MLYAHMESFFINLFYNDLQTFNTLQLIMTVLGSALASYLVTRNTTPKHKERKARRE